METPVTENPKPGLSFARLLPLVVLLAGLGAFFALGLNKYLTLDLLRENRDVLKAWVAENKPSAFIILDDQYLTHVIKRHYLTRVLSLNTRCL